MSVESYCEWASGRRKVGPFDHPSPIEADMVEVEGIEVLEGEAAEISHRIYLEQRQREDFDRALVLLP